MFGGFEKSLMPSDVIANKDEGELNLRLFQNIFLASMGGFGAIL
jgi:hypothetical protein